MDWRVAWRGALAAAFALLLCGAAAAQDSGKVAIGQRGGWEQCVSELGQNKGIFKRHGLVVEPLYTQGSAETMQSVISNSVDLGIGMGTHATLGAFMKGGAIEVTGNTSDWVGAEMRGGLIRIGGDAGGQIGAAYRGSLKGMSGGTILIGGSAGIEVGMRMRRGVIAVRGKVRDFAGLQMKGGTIVLGSGAEFRTGAWMIRGTIISLKPLKLLPTFPYACTYNPEFLRVYARHLGLGPDRLADLRARGII